MFDPPIGYYEGNQGMKVRFTFRNSFESGILEVKQSTKPIWSTVEHGESRLFSEAMNLDIRAIDSQEYPAGYFQRYRRWKKDREYFNTQNPIEQTVETSRTYSAIFSKEFDVEFHNDFNGTDGGQIKIEGDIKDAPNTVHILEESAFVTAEAINDQNINGIIYNFDHWDNRTTTNPYTFSIIDHTQITAIFKAELNIELGGPTSLDYNEQGTFTANPSGGESPYTNYRWWERKDDGILLSPLTNGGITPLAPPTGYWIEQYGWEGQQSVQFARAYNFSLKCEVTDSDNNTATDIHSVTILGGFLAKVQRGKEVNFLTAVPENVELTDNYPNPFNPSTTLNFGLPEETNIRLTIYSNTGQKIVSLADGIYSKGYHEIKWDGKNQAGNSVSNSIYIYELKAGDQRLIKKMVFAK